MGCFVVFPIVFISFVFFSGFCCSQIIYPNFTASNFKFIDHTGAFLFSQNGTFKAAMYNPGAGQVNFYLCVIHVSSNTIIWSANRDNPISNSGTMNLTANGIVISEKDGNPKWSTPRLQSSVSALLLAETGNLVLLDRYNGSLWESFSNPTDMIVDGQKLLVGSSLSNAISNTDLSTGDYSFTVGASDAVLQWYGQTYWKLSMDTKAYINSKYVVEYMAINRSGLYLFGHNGSVVVIQVILSQSDFHVAKLDNAGQFTVSSFSGTTSKQEFVGPDDACRVPFFCHRIGLCTNDAASTTPVCSCPSGFLANSQNTSDCVPSDSSFSLPSSCNLTNNNSQSNSSEVLYLSLAYGMEYFSIDFSVPVTYGINMSFCQNLCSNNCSCLGFFYENSSDSCYLLEDELGSIISSTTGKNNLFGYIKALHKTSPTNTNILQTYSNQRQFPLVALVLIPFFGLSLLIAIGVLWWRRNILSRAKTVRLGGSDFHTSEEFDEFSIPGLPRRFKYEELEMATDNFITQIGSGGFGSVYKGVLSDESLVAVKKITNLGIQGKKEFCTEIAIIGNIRHANLVKLRGFCAQKGQRLLVYEYMNRGSLDRTLFGSGPVLEWQERVDIALGTARGLAYLHSGCEPKIIHCDVKPENILLHDHFQVKISDFGLSKILNTEQSSLFTTMRGTRGYLAPEWLTNSAVSDKTDVYSFGMVLLELVSGRKNCGLRTPSFSINDEASSGGYSPSSSVSALLYFPLFALEKHEQGRYLDLTDPRLFGRVTNEEVEKLVCVALCCVHEEPTLRPNMVTVVSMLEGGIPLSRPRMESLNFLRFYGRQFCEASIIEEGNELNDAILSPQINIASSLMPYSYISSQQISGPR